MKLHKENIENILIGMHKMKGGPQLAIVRKVGGESPISSTMIPTVLIPIPTIEISVEEHLSEHFSGEE